MNVNLMVTEKTTDERVSIPLVVEEQVLIGRHLSSPVPLRGIGLSRDHFALEARDGALFVEDLSSNGTWLNGERLSSDQADQIHHGDIIEVPGYSIEISIAGAEPQMDGPLAKDSADPNGKPVAPWFNALKTAKGFFNGFEVILILSTVFTFALIFVYVSL